MQRGIQEISDSSLAEFLKKCLEWIPERRIKGRELLEQPYFVRFYWVRPDHEVHSFNRILIPKFTQLLLARDTTFTWHEWNLVRRDERIFVWTENLALSLVVDANRVFDFIHGSEEEEESAVVVVKRMQYFGAQEEDGVENFLKVLEETAEKTSGTRYSTV